MTIKLMKFKALAFCAILLTGIIFPATLTAQRNDGFFKSGEDTYSNRDDYLINADLELGGVVHNENPTTVPVGNGLLVLVIAGAGYVYTHRKHFNKSHMSHLSYVLLAAVIILGLTQCKKKIISPAANEDGNNIHITLDATYGGAKTDFDGTSSFVWTAGKTEVIEVGIKMEGGTTKNIGLLTGTGNGTSKITFTGTMTGMEHDFRKNEILYFIYAGSMYDHDKVITNGDNTLHLTDQHNAQDSVTKYHLAVGQAKCEVASQRVFNATLDMEMAIAKFELSGFEDTVRLSGKDIYSVAEVDFRTGNIEGKMKGSINLGTNGVKYVALIPSTEGSTTLTFASKNKTASMVFQCGIKKGYYYTDDGYAALQVVAEDDVDLKDEQKPVFSVASDKQVMFSKGNLQYQASTDTWQFAENQYDYIGSANSNVSSTYSGWIDLFGWGTSGYHYYWDVCNQNYYPYSTSSSVTITGLPNTVPGYGPTYVGLPSTPLQQYNQANFNFAGVSVDYDWGVFNAISNGGDAPSKWRTLKNTEWMYMLKDRQTSIVITDVNGASHSDARYTPAVINVNGGVNGIIIIPDNYDGVTVCTEDIQWGAINGGNTRTQCSITGWSYLASKGCVFLPAAGYRKDGSSISILNAGTAGYYWSSCRKKTTNVTSGGAVRNAMIMAFGTSVADNEFYRDRGCSVRLVRDVN